MGIHSDGGLMPTAEEMAEVFKEFYPGSSKTIDKYPNRAVAQKQISENDWDAKPKFYLVAGERREFFMVGDLARALGRQAVTIRKWERDGILPRSKFRTPSRTDDDRGRRRLYTRTQIEGVVAIAREEGVLVSHAKPISRTDFTVRVQKLFKEAK